MEKDGRMWEETIETRVVYDAWRRPPSLTASQEEEKIKGARSQPVVCFHGVFPVQPSAQRIYYHDNVNKDEKTTSSSSSSVFII